MCLTLMSAGMDDGEIHVAFKGGGGGVEGVPTFVGGVTPL